MPQPGDKGVLGSWGQSQLPQLMLLDVLMAPASVPSWEELPAFASSRRASRPGTVPRGMLIWPYVLPSPAITPVLAVPLPFSSAPAG